jgi:fibronectin type 3 domain-containing protein
LSGSRAALDWGTGTDITRDLVYTPLGTFAVDLASGNYDVMVTFGEYTTAHEQMGIFLEGVQVDSVDTAKNEFVTKTYSVSVSDGQLTLLLDDLGGSNPYVAMNALEIALGGPDTTGPRVVDANPQGTVTGPVDRINLAFSEAIDRDTFSLADVALTGPSGAIAPTAVNWITDSQYEVTFPSQNTPGDYQLTVGSDVADLAGNLMDQDQDGIVLEVPDDRFVTGFTLQVGPSYVVRLDFGKPTSPVAAGYTGFSTDAYSAGVGYGWLSGSRAALDWGTGTDITRDLVYTPLGTFAVDLANGNYDVVITLGEAITRHDKMGIFLEGVQVDSVDTAKNEFVTKTYSVSVSDGQLTLLLDDLGGSNPYVAINALEIVVSPLAAVQAETSADLTTRAAVASHPANVASPASHPTAAYDRLTDMLRNQQHLLAVPDESFGAGVESRRSNSSVTRRVSLPRPSDRHSALDHHHSRLCATRRNDVMGCGIRTQVG